MSYIYLQGQVVFISGVHRLKHGASAGSKATQQKSQGTTKSSTMHLGPMDLCGETSQESSGSGQQSSSGKSRPRFGSVEEGLCIGWHLSSVQETHNSVCLSLCVSVTLSQPRPPGEPSKKVCVAGPGCSLSANSSTKAQQA